MRLVFLGPPGAGKGTQAARLIDALGVIHVSTGDMLRAAVKEGTELGRSAKRYMDDGALVPDEVVVGIVAERLQAPDASRGVMLDGFPRTIPQAEALDRILNEAGRPLDKVALLEVPDALIVERITGRRTDPETGRIYHLSFDPPPPQVEGRLVHRDDDTEEKVRNRLSAYHAQTAPLVPYYEAQGKLVRIDGVGEPDEVTQRLLTALQPA